ncbi:MAG: hypothetical protein OEZ06_04795 [Myxococcales bacterium]|nr:hypothetical protein [Myxococcales bacterium]
MPRHPLALSLFVCLLTASFAGSFATLGCGDSKPAEEPAPAAAPPQEPEVDRLTMLKEAQARIKAEREKQREAMRAVGVGSLKKKKQIGSGDKVKIEMHFEFENLGDKDLNQAIGVIEFRDKNDTLFKSMKVPFNQPIKAGAKAEKTGKFPVDPADDGDVALVKVPLDKIKMQWVPNLYRFADGSELRGE